jgi:gluconokinase
MNYTHNRDIPWALGIDLGTGSCKSVVISLNGHVLGFGASGYEALNGTDRWKEQNPEAVIQGMARAVRVSLGQAGVTAENCQGVSLGGAMHTLLALDKAGKPVTGVITWVDDRAAPQAKAVRASYGSDLYKRTGCPAHCIYPLYKIAWLRQENPEIFRQTSRFVSAKEYVLKRLTGEFVVDPGIAAGSGLLQVEGLVWDAQALEGAGIDARRLSSIQPSTCSLPMIDTDLAARMGLNCNTRVILGSSDAVNSSLGAGAVHPDMATCMVGSSGAFRIISNRPVLDSRARSWCYPIDAQRWLVGGAINNAGLALAWLCDMLNRARPELSPGSPVSPEQLIELAGQVGVGAEGLLCLPFFAGERSPNWNMNARGVFFGLSLGHDIRHMARALLEGVAFRIRSVKEILEENGLSIHRVCASGGFTQSKLWLQIMADVVDQPMTLPVWGETSSLGAAFWVLLANGVVKNIEELAHLVEYGSTCNPVKGEVSIYNDCYAVYREVYEDSLRGFERLRGLDLGGSSSANDELIR